MFINKKIRWYNKYWTKRRLMEIAVELGVVFKESYLDYVLVDKLYYHLIDFLYGTPIETPKYKKKKLDERVKKLESFIKEFLVDEEELGMFAYAYIKPAGNNFRKKVIKEILKKVIPIDSTDKEVRKVLEKLKLTLEMIEQKFVGQHLIVLTVPDTREDRRINEERYFHEAIHVLLNESGIYLRKDWYYHVDYLNEGIVTYLQAKFGVKGDLKMPQKIITLKEMFKSIPMKYLIDAEIWDRFFEKTKEEGESSMLKLIKKGLKSKRKLIPI